MLGIHAIGIAAIVVCILLAQWQWSRAHVPNSGEAAVPTGNFEELSPRLEYLPVGSIGVRTSVTGTWLDEKTFFMRGRSAQGSALLDSPPFPQPCDWVVTPLLLDNKSVLAVVRGCTEVGTTPQSVSGPETVTGVLQPSELSSALRINDNVEPLTTELVVSKADSSAHDGYLVLDEPTTGLIHVQPILANSPEVPLHWRNVFYTFNWLFFGFIVAAMWLRVVRDEISDVNEGD